MDYRAEQEDGQYHPVLPVSCGKNLYAGNNAYIQQTSISGNGRVEMLIINIYGRGIAKETTPSQSVIVSQGR